MKIPIIIKIFTALSLMILTIFVIIFGNLIYFVVGSLRLTVLVGLFLSLLVIILNLLFIKNSKKYYFLGFSGYLIFNLLLSYISYWSYLNYKIGDYFGNIFHIVFGKLYTYFGDIIISLLILLILLLLIIVFIKYIVYYLKLRKLSEADFIVENDSKGIFISYIFFLLFLVIFYFTYYNIPIKIDNIDDKFFISRYENIENKNIELKNTINKIISLQKKSNFNEKELNKIEMLYKCIGILGKLSDKKDIPISYCKPEDYYKMKLDNERNTIYLRINELRGLEDKESKNNLKSFRQRLRELDKTSSKEFKNNYLYNTGALDYINLNNELVSKLINNSILFGEEGLDYNILFSTQRQFFHNYLYYLDNNNPNKALDLVLNSYKLGNKIMNGETGLMGLLVGLTISTNGLNQLDYIIENYQLTDNSKNKIYEVLNKNLNIEDNFKNAIAYEYKNQRNELIYNLDLNDNIFFNKKDTDNLLKNIFYRISNVNNNLDFDKEYSYNIKFNNPFKRNYIGYQIINSSIGTYSYQGKKLIKLKEARNNILEKLRN